MTEEIPFGDIDADSFEILQDSYTPQTALEYTQKAHGPSVRQYIEQKIQSGTAMTADEILNLIPEARGNVKEDHFKSANMRPVIGRSIDK